MRESKITEVGRSPKPCSGGSNPSSPAIQHLKEVFARLDSKYGRDWTEWQDVRDAIAALDRAVLIEKAFTESLRLVKDWCRCNPRTATWTEQIDGEKTREVRCPKHWPVVPIE